MADHSDEASYIQLTATIVSPTFSTTPYQVPKFCSAALVIPSCEGIGVIPAFACAVRHSLALSSYKA